MQTRLLNNAKVILSFFFVIQTKANLFFLIFFPQVCSSLCVQCYQTPNQCTMCRDDQSLLANGSYVIKLNTLDGDLTFTVPYGSCVQSCGIGRYSDLYGVCKPCSDSCRECLGDPLNCTVCPSSSPYKVFDSMINTASCLPTCPAGTYADSDNLCQSKLNQNFNG
jgi:hypothetical protein